MKSNSFCSKANIKGSEEVQTQKLVVDVKDGPKKLAGKSVSLKGLGCSSVGLVSPKCSPIQELKGQKQIRDHTSLEIKNSIKLDNSFSVHTTVNSTERLPRGDYISTSSLTSYNYKNAQSDGKLTSSRKSLDAMASLGNFIYLLLFLTSWLFSSLLFDDLVC